MERNVHLFFYFVILISCHRKENVEIELREKVPNMGDSLYALGDSLYYLGLYTEAKQIYLNSQMAFCGNNDSSILSNVFNQIGLCHQKKGDYDSAIQYYQKAFKVDSIFLDSIKLIGRVRNLGIIESNRGNYDKALLYYHRALRMATKISHQENINALNNSLALTYLDQGRNNLALEYFKKAFEGYITLKDTLRTGIALNNIGLAFDRLEIQDSALHYYIKSKKIKETKSPQTLSFTFFNIGKLYRKTGRLDSAYHYLSRAYRLRKQSGDKSGKAFAANEMANLFLMFKQPDSARFYLDEALEYAQLQKNPSILMQNHQTRADYYRHLGNMHKAYTYLENWAHLRDSVFNTEKLKTLETQSKFDLEQKENEKKMAEQQTALAIKEKDHQAQNARLGLILLLVLVVFLTISLFFMYTVLKQRKALKILNMELERKTERIQALNRQNFHFTKNSLTEVVSLLNLQAKQLEAGELRGSLLDGKLRMETVNLLYHQLFAQPDGTINVKDFIEQVVNNTMEAVLGPSSEANAEIYVEPLELKNEITLNVGLIINEVCLNACKYALKGGNGRFMISLINGAPNILLTMSDNGPGFSNGNKNQTTSSFGLKLIRLLVSDLQGTLEIDSSPHGLKYIIVFPK